MVVLVSWFRIVCWHWIMRDLCSSRSYSLLFHMLRASLIIVSYCAVAASLLMCGSVSNCVRLPMLVVNRLGSDWMMSII